MAPGPGSDQQRQRMRPAAVITAAVVVTLLSALFAGLAVLYFGGDPSSTGQGAVPLPGASARPSPTDTTSSTPSPAEPSPTRQVPPGSQPFRYQPLWPFASVAEAAEWQREYRDDGRQPWHLDADETALAFTNGFLGFTEIDQVVDRSLEGDEAWISVGYDSGEGPGSVAAVLHLVRIGPGDDAPWEVVGSRDSTLTLDRPRYAALVSSPITVGGRITGVDESIRVDVRQSGSERPLGASCCVPAGGEKQPWSIPVSFRGAAEGAVTIVASTGGHVQDVERFAITGVRVG
ncbi:hypothetical protein ACIBL3_19095 [Kribbella sp. NPDC050124]|uniref:hypothetical protein n=1 Tax=Kribbella sp. NPDC050124 TaxID=3364114 RepID=UPI00379EA84F